LHQLLTVSRFRSCMCRQQPFSEQTPAHHTLVSAQPTHVYHTNSKHAAPLTHLIHTIIMCWVWQLESASAPKSATQAAPDKHSLAKERAHQSTRTQNVCTNTHTHTDTDTQRSITARITAQGNAYSVQWCCASAPVAGAGASDRICTATFTFCNLIPAVAVKSRSKPTKRREISRVKIFCFLQGSVVNGNLPSLSQTDCPFWATRL